jgi:hypothetical protein
MPRSFKWSVPSGFPTKIPYAFFFSRDSLQILRGDVNISSKKWRTAEKGWSSSSGFGERATTPQLRKSARCKIFHLAHTSKFMHSIFCTSKTYAVLCPKWCWHFGTADEDCGPNGRWEASCPTFWFGSFPSKYLNSATVSKNVLALRLWSCPALRGHRPNSPAVLVRTPVYALPCIFYHAYKPVRHTSITGAKMSPYAASQQLLHDEPRSVPSMQSKHA